MSSTSSKEVLYEVVQRKTLERLNIKDQIKVIKQASTSSTPSGTSDIYIGFWQAEGRQTKVAVKKLRAICKGDDELVKSLAREVYIWSRVNHRNIQPLLGYYLDGDGLFPHLVSEWAARGSLSDYLRAVKEKNKDLSTEETLGLAEGIAAGVSYLHTNNIFHADLKSPNILIPASGQPLITDFGISYSMSATMSAMRGTSSMVDRVTPRYTAIELLFDSDESPSGITPRSLKADVWSFGMVLFELLTREIPYSDLKIDARVILAIRKGVLPKHPFPEANIYCRRLWDICQKCWARNPDDRPSSRIIHCDIDEVFLQFAAANKASSDTVLPPTTSSEGPCHRDNSDLRNDQQNGTGVDPSPFPPWLAPQKLATLVSSKSLDDLDKLGGVKGLKKGLGVSTDLGTGDDLEIRDEKKEDEDGRKDVDEAHSNAWVLPSTISLADRQRVYGQNTLQLSTIEALQQDLQDRHASTVLRLLTITAFASLAPRLFQNLFLAVFTFNHIICDGRLNLCSWWTPWTVGIAAEIIIVHLAVTPSIARRLREMQLKTLASKGDVRRVSGIRDGSEQFIKVADLVVGDIVILEPGEIVPCDGILLDRSDVKCDEFGPGFISYWVAAATGTLPIVSKFIGKRVASKKLPEGALRSGKIPERTDCFIVSGTRVLEGTGSYLVLAVGPNSVNGKKIRERADGLSRNKTTTSTSSMVITQIGVTACFFLCFVTWNRWTSSPVPENSIAVMQTFTTSVTLLLIAFPEGLLSVFATKRLAGEPAE